MPAVQQRHQSDLWHCGSENIADLHIRDIVQNIAHECSVQMGRSHGFVAPGRYASQTQGLYTALSNCPHNHPWQSETSKARDFQASRPYEPRSLQDCIACVRRRLADKSSLEFAKPPRRSASAATSASATKGMNSKWGGSLLCQRRWPIKITEPPKSPMLDSSITTSLI